MGTLVSTTPAEWAVTREGGELTRVPRNEVVRVDVRVSRRNTVRGALIGGGIGLVIGVFAAVAAGDDCDGAVCDELAGLAQAQLLLYTPVAGALAGAVVGSVIRSHRWVPVVEPGRDGGRWEVRWRVPLGGPAGAASRR